MVLGVLRVHLKKVSELVSWFVCHESGRETKDGSEIALLIQGIVEKNARLAWSEATTGGSSGIGVESEVFILDVGEQNPHHSGC